MGQSRLIIETIKKYLKSKGLTYADLSVQMEISETSVKRIFSHKSSMSLNRLEEICTILKIDFFELAKTAQSLTGLSDAQLNERQETALVVNPKLFVFFYSIIKGLSIEDVIKAYTFSKKEVQTLLLEMDKLSLIELREKNQFKLIVSPSIEWIDGGPLEKHYVKEMLKDFLKYDFKKELESFRFITGHLSKKSLENIRYKIEALADEIKAVSNIDKKINSDEIHTRTFLLSYRAWTPSPILKYLRK